MEFEGRHMHVLDDGGGQPILLLHGEPTSSYLWRNVIPPLVAAGYRTIAPDLVGFGRSDKPEEIGWYSYDRHVASVAQLVEELDLNDVTLVVHDWGGPIGLRVAIEHEERIARLVILNTGIGVGAPSETWLRFREAVRKAGGALDIGRLVEAGTVQGISEEVRAAYNAPFPTPASKAGALAFPEHVATEPEHPNAAAMQRIRDALRDWSKPTLVIWGAEDSVLPVRVAEDFVELIPGARGPVLLEGAGHFLQEDRPAELAAAILDFLEAD